MNTESNLPWIISEWIDDDILPSLADGHHSAAQIYNSVQSQCYERLLKEMNGEPYPFPEGNLPLSDSWMLVPTHRKQFVEYVQEAFDSWEEEQEQADEN